MCHSHGNVALVQLGTAKTSRKELVDRTETKDMIKRISIHLKWCVSP